MPQPSVAVTVNVRVTVQPLVESMWLTLFEVALHVSVALDADRMLASLGGLVGLQPRLPPAGTVSDGGVVSTVQV